MKLFQFKKESKTKDNPQKDKKIRIFNLIFDKNDFLYLSMLSFVFVSLFGLNLRAETVLADYKLSLERSIKDINITSSLPSLPKLRVSVTSYPILTARAAYVLDLDSKVPLYEKNPDEKYLPASTTKIMTALVAMDVYQDGDLLTVDGEKVDGQKMGLVKGESIYAKDLLDGLLIFSANDAAEVLASNNKEGRQEFINRMNQKAKDLNMTNTHFENPTGFDNWENFSTAKDLARISVYAMQNQKFADIVKNKTKTVVSADGKIVHRLSNTNKLIGEVDGVLGVKTGWTEMARENLVTYIQKDGKKVMLVLLGSQDRFGETKELINWVFTNYEWKQIEFPPKG